MKLANEDVSMLAFTSEQITAPFLLPEMVDKCLSSNMSAVPKSLLLCLHLSYLLFQKILSVKLFLPFRLIEWLACSIIFYCNLWVHRGNLSV